MKCVPTKAAPLLCLGVCLGGVTASHAQSQEIDWPAVRAAAAESRWGDGALLLSRAHKKLLPREEAVYDYYLGSCACHLTQIPKIASDGRALLKKYQQKYIGTVTDPQKQQQVRDYIQELLKTPPDTATSFIQIAENTSINGHGGGSTMKINFLPDDATVTITPFRVLENAVTLPHDRLVSILKMPQPQVIPELQKQMHILSPVRGIFTTNAYSLIAIGDGASSNDSLAAFSGHIDTALRFFRAEYGAGLPQEKMTIFAVSGLPQLQDVARSLHGVQQSSIDLGYSVADEGVAVAIGQDDEHSKTGTLYHELSHLVFENDFPGIPAWLDEGIASVYSVFTFTNDGKMSGTSTWDRNENKGQWRAEILKRVGKNHPKATGIIRLSSEEFYTPSVSENNSSQFLPQFTRLMEKQAVNNATACYLLLYFQERGKLASLYKAFRDRDVRTIEGDFGAADAKLAASVIEKTEQDLNDDFESYLRRAIPNYPP